jgi:hypothetical protein
MVVAAPNMASIGAANAHEDALGGTQDETAAYGRRAHDLAVRLHRAERNYARAVWRFVHCLDCGLLRAVTTTAAIVPASPI